METLVKFTEQIEYFCNFICNLLDEPNIQLKGHIGAVRLLNKSNPKSLSKMLYEYLSKYDNEINTQNESFFIQLSYQEQDKFDEFLYLIDYLREKVKDENLMNKLCTENNTDTNKQRIWKYIKVIYYLSKKVNNV